MQMQMQMQRRTRTRTNKRTTRMLLPPEHPGKSRVLQRRARGGALEHHGRALAAILQHYSSCSPRLIHAQPGDHRT